MDQFLKLVLSHPETPQVAILIAVKTAVIYIFLIGGLRLLGKRELGQMTIYDVVLMVVLANSVQNAMVGDDSTLFGGLISAVTLLVMNRLFTLLLSNSKKVERLMVGEPVVLMINGEVIQDAMNREGLSEDILQAALREHGIEKISEVHMAVLEVDGSISIVPSMSVVHRTKRHYRAIRL